MTDSIAFWGLFVALAVILVGYIVWLVAAERAEGRDPPEEPPR